MNCLANAEIMNIFQPFHSKMRFYFCIKLSDNVSLVNHLKLGMIQLII